MSSPPTEEATSLGSPDPAEVESQSHLQAALPEPITMNPVVVDLVYEKLLSSLSIDVACEMHRMMKTGVYPSSELLVPQDRSQIYPKVYAGKKKNPRQEEKRYSVVLPQKRKRKRLVGDEDNGPIEEYLRSSSAAAKKIAKESALKAAKEAASVETGMDAAAPDKAPSNPPAASAGPVEANKPPFPPAVAASSAAATVRRPPPAQYLDIWGKAPPKEPKEMVGCLICGRQVNTLRFAPHLDKCMGIGTTVRAAALAASGFVPLQQQQQMSSSNSSSSGAGHRSNGGVGLNR